MEETHTSKPQEPVNHKAADEHASRALSDNYVIIGPLAETELSNIAIIRELSSGRHLLAKTVSSSNPAVQQRFHEAILVHGRLQHQNVAQTIDWRLSEDGKPVFISEFLEGINLQDLIDEVGTLEDDDEITTFIFQLCDALEYAHSQGVIHGGLKPSNVVLIKPEDNIIVKILDFGATNKSRELPEHPEIASSPYLSPEQRSGEASVVSDVFSLAAVAYQLITGYLPFIKIDDGRVLDETASELAPIIEYRPDIPEVDRLGEVLVQALVWDPARRTATVKEFKKGVADWYHSIGDDQYATGQQRRLQEGQVGAVSAVQIVEESDLEKSDWQQTDRLNSFNNRTSEIESQEEETAADEPVSEIGLIVRSQDPLKRTLAEPVYREQVDDDLDYLDDLDELDERAQEGDSVDIRNPMVITQPDAKMPLFSPSPEVSERATSEFGADIADDEFGFEDPNTASNNLQEDTIAPHEIGNTPIFMAPGHDVDMAKRLADSASSELTIPPDQELSGRFSRVARLPALPVVPGMQPTLARPPVAPEPLKTDMDLEHDKEKETIKKFKKPPKRRLSKLDSTMTKLMALRSTQVEQELTVSTKISETFAKAGPKQSPKMVIVRIVASVVILAASAVLLLSNMTVLSSVWTVASRDLSAILLKKHADNTDITADTTHESITEEIAKRNRISDASKKESDTPQVNPAASAAARAHKNKLQTNIIYTPRIIDRRSIAPHTMPPPGTRRYTGEVYPYLYTEEMVQRDPRKPRPTDSPIKEITGK